MTEEKPHLKYRPDIDGLRAIAVLLVVCFHAYPDRLLGGFIGVDIFFVISGFLISSILYRENNRGGISFADFYSRRVRRIFPALIVVLLASLIAGWFLLLPDEYSEMGKHVVAATFFISNLVLWGESGYFDVVAELKPLLHLWSLGIEEQFYLLWPLVIWGLSKLKTKILTAVILLALLSFACNIYSMHTNPVADFYSPFTRFWELLSGAILAYMASCEKSVVNSTSTLLKNCASITGIGLLIAALLLISRTSAFPGWFALLPVSAALLLIFAGPYALINRLILSNKIVVWFGLISYPLYLWHWPIFSFLHIIGGAQPEVHIRSKALLASIFLACITYYYVEKPIRSKKKFTASLLVGMLIVALIGSIIYFNKGFATRAAVQNANYTQSVSEQLVPAWKYAINQTCLKKYPLQGSDEYGWWFCVVSSNEDPTILLLGNSFANHLYPGIIKQKSFANQSILSIGTCGAEWVDGPSLVMNSPTHPCSGLRQLEQQKFINAIIARTPSLRYAILGGLDPDPSPEYTQKLIKRILFLQKNGVQVIAFIPHIVPPFDTKQCFSRPLNSNSKNCDFTIEQYQNWMKRFDALVSQVSIEAPETLFFNQNQLFCSQNKCSFVRDGLPLFRDEHHHLSEYGSDQLFKIFIEWATINAPEMVTTESLKMK